MVCTRGDDTPRPRLGDEFVDFSQRRRLGARGEERGEHRHGLLRTEARLRLGGFRGSLGKTHFGQLQISARARRLGLRGGFEKFPRPSVIVRGAFEQTDRSEELRITFAADVRRRHRRARGRDVAGQAQRVALDPTDLGLGGLAQLERRGRGKFLAFAGLHAGDLVVRKLHIAADRKQHVLVALLEALFEERLRGGLAIKSPEKCDKCLLVFPLIAIEAPVHKRVRLLRPRAAEHVVGLRGVVRHRK